MKPTSAAISRTIARMKASATSVPKWKLGELGDEQQHYDDAGHHRARHRQEQRGVDDGDPPVEQAQLANVAVVLGAGRARVKLLHGARAVDHSRQPARPAR